MAPKGTLTNAVTLASYEAAADVYAQLWQPHATRLVFLEAFLALLPAGACVLEIGSGPGHDAELLESRGARVRRTDATRAFVSRLRARGLAADVLNVLTDELGGPWDAVYANAVFLHMNTDELAVVVHKAAAAVFDGGLLAFTLKEGDGEAWTTAKLGRPRHFTYWRERSLRSLLAATP